MRPRPDAGPGRPPVPGALVLGGDYRALGVVRSLGRRGIPVWVVQTRGDNRLAGLSRYCRRLLWLPPAEDISRREELLDLARRHGLAGWALFPTADATAAFAARQYESLSEYYRVTTPPWATFRWGYDKRLTAQLAHAVGVSHPRTVSAPDRVDAERYAGPFPVIVKPATKPYLNRPVAKAWPARDAAELLRCYDEAAGQSEPGSLLLQELIPGSTRVQYSFAALCRDGRAVASVTAERVRQYPADFGRSSTFVVTVTNDEVERAARLVLANLRLTGLAELEFKRDPRDGAYHLLDINLRVWGWHTIAQRIGLDFPYLNCRLLVGEHVEETRSPAGIRWLRLSTDLAAGAQEIFTGDRSTGSYLRSLLEPHEHAVAAGDDPLPGLAEVPSYLVSEVISRRGREAPGALRPATLFPRPRLAGAHMHARTSR